MSDGEVIVSGILCARGHFNKPTAGYCSRCGLSMLQQTHIPTKGPRPPLGVLLFDDGRTVSLDSDYVIGREPGGDPSVVAGRARPLQLADPQRSVSRVHADLRLVGWEVTICDRGSANGTAVRRSPDAAWERLEPEAPAELAAGAEVRFGARTAVFQTRLRA